MDHHTRTHHPMLMSKIGNGGVCVTFLIYIYDVCPKYLLECFFTEERDLNLGVTTTN